jgi:hypothetical protein
LLRVGASGAGHAPSGALAAVPAADGETVARVTRMLAPAPRLPTAVLALIWSTAAVLVAVPVALLLLPLW